MPTVQTLAAIDIVLRQFPELKVRVIIVVDLLKLLPPDEQSARHERQEFDVLFTKDKRVVFAHHGYPTLIHRLTVVIHER